ncbi:MAG: tRNA pseudouridine(55) synthase TruB [Chloroflexia bacterium]
MSHPAASGAVHNSRPDTSGPSGVLNIDKPRGLTSHDVVARVRRLTGQRRAGHAGTLDPLATGVLPVVLGKATRLVEYLSDAGKAYRATLILGATTDTYDGEGTITPTPNAVMPSSEELELALKAFRGEIEQVPPMYSAVKVGGKKLYELARKGAEMERAPRRVTISRLDLEAYNAPRVTLYVECSKGTYIRSLAHDLGAALGTGAYLDALVRTCHGPFNLDAAITLESLEESAREGAWQRNLLPPESILEGWVSLRLDPRQAEAAAQGRPLQLPPPVPGSPLTMAASSQAGDLLAILYWDEENGSWRPKKVFT